MIIKMKIHCAPKKGSFLRSLAHLHPLLKGQPLGRCPLPRPAPTLQWLLPHTEVKTGVAWGPAGACPLSSLSAVASWPHFPTSSLGPSHTSLHVFPKPTCRTPP